MIDFVIKMCLLLDVWIIIFFRYGNLYCRNVFLLLFNVSSGVYYIFGFFVYMFCN